MNERDKLEAFAGFALVGMLAHGVSPRKDKPRSEWHAAIATEAFYIAEAMVEESKRYKLRHD